jgi:hypothetical protein
MKIAESLRMRTETLKEDAAQRKVALRIVTAEALFAERPNCVDEWDDGLPDKCDDEIELGVILPVSH